MIYNKFENGRINKVRIPIKIYLYDIIRKPETPFINKTYELYCDEVGNNNGNSLEYELYYKIRTIRNRVKGL